LILSARDEESEKVAALDAGANDYLTKPFRTAELLARIRVWLRHTQRASADALGSVLEVGDLRIDFAKRLAFVGGQEVSLTPTQYKLFATLMRNAGRVLTHEQILFSVWGPAYTKETQYLRVYMGKLRQKFEVDPARPRYFVTELGVGYRLRAD
jgi:two-component system KDP operon response regulator KdpE